MHRFGEHASIMKSANMPTGLQVSQDSSSVYAKEHHVSESDSQNSNHSLDSLDSQETFVEEIEFFERDSSLTTKLLCSSSEYANELLLVRIKQKAVVASQLKVFMKQDKLDSRCDKWSNAILQVTNELEVIIAIHEHLLKDIDQMRAVNTQWRFQQKFSEKLGQPKPDFTFGLPIDSILKLYPQVCSRPEYFSLIRPLSGMALPIVYIEAKGPASPLSEAIIQNRHNAACGIKNIVGIKRAAGRAPNTYKNKDLSKSIEIIIESVQVTSHWMEVDATGADCYYSRLALFSFITHQHLKITRLIKEILDWSRKIHNEMLKDLEVLELRLEKEKAGSLKRTRSMSASEADGEQVNTQAIKKQRRAR